MADEKNEKKRTGYYLADETVQAVAEHAKRAGLSVSAAADDLIQRGAGAAAAHHAGALAVPAIEEAVARKVEELLRAVVVGPLRAELAAIHHEATVARLEGYAHIYNDYGAAVAEQLEAVAEERATAARAAGERARLHRRVAEDQVA